MIFKLQFIKRHASIQ